MTQAGPSKVKVDILSPDGRPLPSERRRGGQIFRPYQPERARKGEDGVKPSGERRRHRRVANALAGRKIDLAV